MSPQDGNGSASANATATWQFVNISEPKQSKANGYRTMVRANAMRDHRRKQKQEAMGQFQKRCSGHNRGDSNTKVSAIAIQQVETEPSNASSSQASEKVWTAALTELLDHLKDVDLAGIVASRAVESTISHDGAIPVLDFQRTHCTDEEKDVPDLPETLPPSPRTILTLYSMDPFNALPANGNSRYSSYVLKHCKGHHVSGIRGFTTLEFLLTRVC